MDQALLLGTVGMGGECFEEVKGATPLPQTELSRGL